MRSAVLVAALVVLVAACGAPALSPSPTPTPGTTTPVSESAPPPGAIAPTRICETVQMDQPAPLTCTEVIGQVLLAMGRDAGVVQAAWFRPGRPCPPNARCIAPPPGSAYVVVRVEGGAIGVFNVTFAGEEVAIEDPIEPTFDIWPSSGQAIPPVGRPDVGPDAPPEITTRDALPLCGEERVGVFDRRVGRNCFLGAVQDGRPAELVSQEVDPAGDAVAVVYRYAGRGPLLVYRSASPAGPGWVRYDCAISLPVEDVPGDDESVFIVGECLATELS